MITSLENFGRGCASVAMILFALAATAGSATGQAPELTARNAVYFELGGNAILYSVNYDRRFNTTWSGRAGFMVVSVRGTDEDTGNLVDVGLAIIPVTANALLGRGTHRLELGIGPLFALGAGSVEDPEVGDVDEFSGGGIAGVTSTFGYRRQPLDGGFVFRAALNPFYSEKPQLWGGISLGWSF